MKKILNTLTMSEIELKEIRKKMGWTQQKLANELGVNLRTVQKWESGETKIRKSTILNIENLRNKYVKNPQTDTVKTPLTDGLFNYSPMEIMTHIHNNPDRFEDEITHQLYIEGKVKDEVIKELEILKKSMKDKMQQTAK